MRSYLCCFMLIIALAACGQSNPPQAVADPPLPPRSTAAPVATATLNPELAPVANDPPTAPPAAPAPNPSATPEPAPASPVPTAEAAPAESIPTPPEAPAPPRQAPLDLPAGVQQVTWNTLRFRYDGGAFAFAETTTAHLDAFEGVSARSAARLIHTPHTCLNLPPGMDCFNAEIGFALYPSGGLDIETWVERGSTFWSPPVPGMVRGALVAGRPALAWPGDGIRGSETTYAIPLGDDILVIGGSIDDAFMADLEFVAPGEAPLVGDTARTALATDLWTEPAGGERVGERPHLYGGSLVTILAVEGDAAWVMTVDGVAGWVHGAGAALASDAALPDPPARFISGWPGRARVVHSAAIPLRVSPHSDAPQLGAPVEPGYQLSVYGVSGDWLHVGVQNPGGGGRSGWMRWFYDGGQYIDSLQP